MALEVLEVVGRMEDENRFVAAPMEPMEGGGKPWSEPLVLPLLFPLPQIDDDDVGGGGGELTVVPLQ